MESETKALALPTESSPVQWTEDRVNLLGDTLGAKLTDAELMLFIEVCKVKGLDPFSRQIYAVKRYSKRDKKEVMTIQTGIDGFRAIAPDLRGFGWSDAPPTGYEKEQLVDDIIALLDTLKLKRIQLMAHDWGGWIAFLLCLRQPDRVQCYLALHIPHPFQTLDSRTLHLWRFWYQWVIASPYPIKIY